MISFAALAWVAVIAILIAYIVSIEKSRKSLPPGPRGLPLVGILPFIRGDFLKYLSKVSKKYGPVVSFKMGNKTVVVLNDWKSIKEVLKTKSDLYAGRPNVFLAYQVTQRKDVVTIQGPMQKELKQFCLQNLRSYGMGKGSMEDMVKDEIDKLVEHLNEACHKKICMDELFFIPVLNIILTITAGNTFERNDDSVLDFSHALRYIFNNLANCATVDFMPYLRFIPGATCYRQFMKSYKVVDKIISLEIDKHLKQFNETMPKDFMDVYIGEILKHKTDNEEMPPYTRVHLNKNMCALISGGVETTESTMRFMFLFMALYPEIQRKVQKEIDDVIGNGRQSTYTDKKLLPYTEATILEVQRYITVTALGFPHAPMADANLQGYNIPKGTYVMANLWSIDHDKDLWGDPEVFRPERFLDKYGHLQKPDYFIPFGMGSRFCLGESLAKMELFLFFVTLLQHFTFHCIAGETPPSLKPVYGISQTPQSFYLNLKKRN